MHFFLEVPTYLVQRIHPGQQPLTVGVIAVPDGEGAGLLMMDLPLRGTFRLTPIRDGLDLEVDGDGWLSERTALE
ncbi:MAG TPA: hypothetical protein VEY30_01460 [Myxococcaceae bacterium]|nr:hypothetical protein [Myxococcaceae bacterium]